MNLCRVSLEEIEHDQPVGKYQRVHREKVNELMEDRFDPFSDENFVSFFSADLSANHMTTILLFRDALKIGANELAGSLFKNVLTDFYNGLAFDEATYTMLNAYCRECYDSGCPACNEMEIE